LLENKFVHNKDLLERIARGDEAAFAKLYLAFYDKVYAVAFMYLKIHELAEDSTQRVFLKLWERHTSLASVENIDSYIFITARNEVSNQLRSLATQQHYRKLVKAIFMQEADSPEELLILKQRAKLIERVIGKLPARQQQAFRLSREKGLRYKEIAGIMKISVPAVKEHISNALRQIRASLLVHKDELLLLLFWLFHS
jgi:RNA polymerase sigma-70 factor, Bacteroides expansion family 1